MYTSNKTQLSNWKQIIALVALALLVWQFSAASVHAEATMNDEPAPITSRLIGYVFAGSTQQGRIVNAEMNLLDMDGNVLASTMTDASGSYKFNVAAGSYTIENGISGETRPATITDGVVMVGLDFYDTDVEVSTGLQLVGATSRIIGYVFGGVNHDVRLVNTAIELLYLDGSPVLNTGGAPIVAITNADGSYSFNVASGDYMLRNTLNGETRTATIADGVVMVGMDFYDVTATAPVPLAVSLNNLGTTVNTAGIALMSAIVLLITATASATLPSKK